MEIQDNKLIIECPEGYMVDKENSTFECIQFKRIEICIDTLEELKEGGYLDE